MKLILIHTTSWVGLVILAIINGAIRQKMYGQFMTELLAHQLSTLTLVILIGVFVYFISGICRLQSSKQALLIGSIWLVMTVTFEFIFGHYIIGSSWNKLFHDYNLFNGRVWIVIVIWTFISPYTFYRIRS